MAMFMNVLVVVIGLSVAGVLAFYRPLRESSVWKATVTPLASIMGSGFLVSAPLMAAMQRHWRTMLAMRGTWGAPASFFSSMSLSSYASFAGCFGV